MVVEPGLERVEVHLGGGPVVLDLLRHVVVDPLRRVTRLVEGDRPDSDENRRDDGCEDQIHDRHRDRSRELQPREVADERVEHERDHRRGEEEEQDVAKRRGQQERENDEDRQPDQLDPARDLDRRAATGHAADRIAAGFEYPAARCDAPSSLLRSGR